MRKFLLFISVGSFFSTVEAQWNPDPTENNLIVSEAAKGTSSISQFATVTDGAGGAYIAWVDTRNSSTSGSDVFLTRVLANGSIAPGFTAGGLVVCDAVNNQDDVFVVGDGSGGVVIAWRDARSTTTNSNDVYAQRFISDGTALWAANGVAVATETYNEQRPTLVLASPGTIGIVWRGTVNGLDLFGNFLNILNGSKILPTDITIISETNTQSNQAMIPDGAGGFIITWTDGKVANNQSSINAQRVTPAGTFLWGSPLAEGLVVAFVAGSNHVNPSIASDGTIGGAVIAFGSTRVATTDANIYAQRINALGTPAWTANGVPVVTAEGNQFNPLVVRSGSSTIITWSDQRVATNNAEVFVQSLQDNDGAINWTADGVRITEVAGNQPNSAANGFNLAGDGAGGATIIYDDARNGTSNLDIYAQRINSTGNLLFAENGAPIATRTGSNQNWPSVVAGEDGKFIVIWRDSRTNTNAELFASILETTGVLPVNFLDIGAVAQAKQVLVSWTTAQEQKLTEYQIERSANGQDFTKAGIVKPRNSTSVQAYSFTDFNPLVGSSFYRIKSIDNDGSFKYSAIVKVQIQVESDKAIHVYPNPATSGVNIQLNGIPAGNYQVRFIDVSGKAIETHKLQKAGENQLFNVPIGKLNRGLYKMQIINANGETIRVESIMKR